MAENLISSPAYRVAFSMYVALGGDPNTTFDSVDAIYAAIDELYGKGTRVTIENLSVEITENGGYLYDNEEITGYKPVSVNVSVPQKYTDEQVESLKETARQEGYDSGYELGVSDGFTQGESEGYNDGYVEGLEDGAADQKELLESITITSNGTYSREDGYNEVTVNVASSGEGGTGQFDFSSLGYDATVTAQCNNIIQSAIEYGNTIAQNWDANNTNMDNMFSRDSNLQYFPVVDTSNVNSMSNAFDGSALTYIPLIDTSNVTNMYCAFHDCLNLKEIPAFDTSKVDNMAETFYHTGITFVPAFDTSNVDQMSFMFAHCYNLQTVPAFDTSKVSSIFNMFANCKNLRSLPLFDFGNVVDCWTFLGETEYPYLTDIGGFKDFGKREELGDWQDIGLTQCPNLTHQSKLNVINNLYDRATAGYNIVTLNFPTDGLTDEEIAIATNKGWTLTWQ